MADAQHAQACRHEVEHLADALADRMEWTATAGTDATPDVERHVLARQVVRKRLSPQHGFKVRTVNHRCQRRRGPCDVGVEVLKSARKLVAVEPFRSSTELRTLQALNDEPKPLDLGPCLRKLGLITYPLA